MIIIDMEMPETCNDYCDNNKSECDRVLEVFKTKTEVKKEAK